MWVRLRERMVVCDLGCWLVGDSRLGGNPRAFRFADTRMYSPSEGGGLWGGAISSRFRLSFDRGHKLSLTRPSRFEVSSGSTAVRANASLLSSGQRSRHNLPAPSYL